MKYLTKKVKPIDEKRTWPKKSNLRSK